MGHHGRRGLFAGALAVGSSRAEPVIGGDNGVGEDVDCGSAARTEGRGHHHAHYLLAGRNDPVRIAFGELSGGRNLIERGLEREMEALNLGSGIFSLRIVSDSG
jgi:hypothetical protein